MSSRTIERWENSDTEPSAGDLAILARVLEVGEEWLRTGEGEMFAHYDTALTSPGSTVQNPTPKTHHATSPKLRDDMEIPGEWLGPIITGAMLVVFDRSSFERVAAMRIKGRRYRLRI